MLTRGLRNIFETHSPKPVQVIIAEDGKGSGHVLVFFHGQATAEELQTVAAERCPPLYWFTFIQLSTVQHHVPIPLFGCT